MSRTHARGSAAVELAIIAPLVILLLLLVVGAGRLVTARMDVSGAAHDGARTASLASDPVGAAADAQSSVEATLGNHGVTCRSLAVSTDTTSFRAGGWVAVDVTCSVDLSDMTLLHWPGMEDVHARFVEPIDAYRSGGS